VPLAWVVFATACLHFKNTVLNEKTARVAGGAIAAAIFVTFVYAGSLFF